MWWEGDHRLALLEWKVGVWEQREGLEHERIQVLR